MNLDIIFKILEVDEFMGVSENIEIAKGKYELPTNWKDSKKRFKRQLQWRLRKQ